MISRFADWCARNIELIIWFNVALLFVSAIGQITNNNFYPMGLCIILVVVIGIMHR
jgi:hypothetical protein